MTNHYVFRRTEAWYARRYEGKGTDVFIKANMDVGFVNIVNNARILHEKLGMRGCCPWKSLDDKCEKCGQAIGEHAIIKDELRGFLVACKGEWLLSRGKWEQYIVTDEEYKNDFYDAGDFFDENDEVPEGYIGN